MDSHGIWDGQHWNLRNLANNDSKSNFAFNSRVQTAHESLDKFITDLNLREKRRLEQIVQCNHQTHSHWHISLKAASNENSHATLETGAQANVMIDKTINDRLQTYQMRRIAV